MRVLCMCRGGNVRSVALKILLTRHLDHDALACGWETTSADTREMLCDWADIIALLNNDFIAMIRPRWLDKVLVYHVGEDVWGNPFAPDLHATLAALIGDELLQGRTLNIERITASLERYQQKLWNRRVLGQPDAPERAAHAQSLLRKGVG